MFLKTLQKDVLNAAARTPIDSDHEGATQGSLPSSRSVLWSCLPLRCAGSGLRLQVRVLLSSLLDQDPLESSVPPCWASTQDVSAGSCLMNEFTVSSQAECAASARRRNKTPAASAGPQASTCSVSRSFDHFSLKKKSYSTPWCLVSYIGSCDLLCAIVDCTLIINDF